MSTRYVCVITYQYEDRIVEIPGNPATKQAAIAAFDRNLKLTFGSEHVLKGRVYSEADYRKHQQRRARLRVPRRAERLAAQLRQLADRIEHSHG